MTSSLALSLHIHTQHRHRIYIEINIHTHARICIPDIIYGGWREGTTDHNLTHTHAFLGGGVRVVFFTIL